MGTPARRRRIAAAVLLPVVVVVVGFGAPAQTRAIDPVRFHDVANLLPFPASTRSWDIDVGLLSADDLPDLVVSYHASVQVYRLEPPTVQVVLYAPGQDPHACAIGDVNADGLGDVYCTRGAGRGTIAKRNHLWIQRPGGWVNRAGVYGVTDPYGRGRHTTFFDLNGDRFPDLFVGNGYPRQDSHLSPNRTFVNVGGERFREVDVGATGEIGAQCAVPGDITGDGWEDLLVCGQDRLHVYTNRWSPDGRTLHDAAPHLGLDLRDVSSVAIADLDLDGRADLVTVQPLAVRIYRGRVDGGLAPPQRIGGFLAARWVTWGDLDGRAGLDLFVVQTCAGGVNVRDVALLDRGGDLGYRADAFVPLATGGCGDVASTIDIDRDGLDEVVVLNGKVGQPPNGGVSGPVQVLTTGPFP